MYRFGFLAAIQVLSAASLVSTASIQSRQSSSACNNSPDLCSRSYSAITHLGAHDSPFVRDASTGFSTSGNQYFNSTVQLSAGVRLLSAQVHKSNGGWHLCHSSCDLLDAGLLSSWLSDIKTWLDENPNDVVTLLLVNSDAATASDLHTEFTEAQITSYAYRPPSLTAAPANGVWPTLQNFIDSKQRLVVFVASLSPSTVSGEMSYLMDEFTFIFENSYDNTSPTDFSCVPDRPTSVKGNVEGAVGSFRMPFMNHFLYAEGLLNIQTPNVDDINVTNSPAQGTTGSLANSAAACKSQYGKAPTFVLVDFFDQGPAIDAVDALNGVTSAVGRTSPPERDTGDDLNSDARKDVSFAGVVALAEQAKAGKPPSRGAWIWASGKWSLGGVNLSGNGSMVGK